ncbi:MAG: CoA transferase [Dehalococcoidia bacterium]
MDLVRALVADAAVTANEMWSAVGTWARRQRSAEATERCGLLGLGFARFPQEPVAHLRDPVSIRHGVTRPRSRGRKPLVVDLTSLWAGPLCANLLGLTDVDVVRVESKQRRAGAQPVPSAFSDLLHRGHDSVVLDFESAVELELLHELVFNADLVLEASRARALAQLGFDADRAVANGTSWLSITARGRTSNTIGFGDDVAADGGLVLWYADEPVVCGDALGDPLSGVVAAAAASEALISDHTQLIDVSMVDICRAAAQGPTEPHQVIDEEGKWWVRTRTARFPVLEPRVRGRSTD